MSISMDGIMAAAGHANGIWNNLLLLALVMGVGLLFGKLARMLRLPSVTGYLLAGLLIGPSLLGRIGFGFSTIAEVKSFELIIAIALGFITFTIGTEFKFAILKMIGKQAAVISIAQALITALFVDAALVVFHFIRPDILDLSTAILLGAIATVTAPAATLMVTRQYRAKGIVTNTLHLAVEISEMVGLLIFSISLAIARGLEGSSVSVISVLVEPLLEILLSLGAGTVLGLLLTGFTKLLKGEVVRYCVVLLLVVLAVAVCELFNSEVHTGDLHIKMSTLMTCLMMGIVFSNTHKKVHNIMAHVEYWTVPLFMIFFVLSGAEFDLNSISLSIIVVGFIYIIFRTIGKYVGSYVSASLLRSEPNVKKYLGITLLPQAAVALAMASIVLNEAFAQASMLSAIIVFSVMVFELLGPLFTKLVLQKAGEIAPDNIDLEDDYNDDEHAAQAEHGSKRKGEKASQPPAEQDPSISDAPSEVTLPQEAVDTGIETGLEN